MHCCIMLVGTLPATLSQAEPSWGGFHRPPHAIVLEGLEAVSPRKASA